MMTLCHHMITSAQTPNSIHEKMKGNKSNNKDGNDDDDDDNNDNDGVVMNQGGFE